MKSAYELALEKTGGGIQEIPDEKKTKIAEINSKYQAKIAEAEFAARERIKKAAGDIAQIEQIKDDLCVEIASIKSQCEQEKEKLRNE